MEKEQIAVVVPVYRTALSENEKRSLSQCLTVLSDYPIMIVKPESLNVDSLLAPYEGIAVEAFPDHFFSSVRAYNKMVLCEPFYQLFARYEYILIYQLDAYVFGDELLHWANLGYDYIGAPWIPVKEKYLGGWGKFWLQLKYRFYKLLKSDKLKRNKYCAYHVGNGGFSLRRVAKFIEVTRYYKDKITAVTNDKADFYPEDVFLHLEVDDPKCRLRKPEYTEALKFSMEMNAEWCFACNNRTLPFGCHARSYPRYYPFWEPIISRNDGAQSFRKVS